MLLTSGQYNGHTKGQIHIEFVIVAKNCPIDAFKNNPRKLGPTKLQVTHAI